MRATKRWSVPLSKGSRCAWYDEPSDDETLLKSEEMIFKSSMLFLGLIGAVPCTWKKPHLPSLHPTKSTLVIGIAISLTMFRYLYQGVSFFIYRLRNEDLTLRVQIIISIYLAFSLFFSTIVSVWADVAKIRKMVLIWMRLSRLYFDLMKKRPKMRWKMAEKISLVVVCVVPTVVLGLVKETQTELQATYEYITPFSYLAVIILPLALLWAAYCSFFALYAKEIHQEIAKCVQQNSLTYDKLQIYRKIWIQMKLYSETISGLNTFFHLLLLVLPTLIIGAYALILHLQEGIYPTSAALVLFCAIVVSLIGCLSVTTDFISNEIKNLYSSILSLQNFSAIENGPQSQIINLYLLENLRPIAPSFCGFLLITKAVVPSMLSAITMNIVILAQLMQPQNT